jgi:hypothetical protein
MISTAPTPFAAGDDWNVFADGRVAVVRISEYHLEVLASRTERVTGAPVPFDRVPIGEREKDEWRAASGRTTRRMTVNGQEIAVPPPPEPTEWPTTKPPFSPGATWIAPNAEVWVMRSRAANDSVPVADVFDDQGRRVGSVRLPAGTRLVGFGAASAYLVRTDSDGLQFLQRYSLGRR